jgi:N-acetylneuraminate synthase
MYIIAEIAQAHEGSLGLAHSYVDAIANTGVDAIKFQTHIAEAESSKEEPFRINFSYEDESRYDYWKRMEFSKEEWDGLKKHAESRGLEFLSTPFSIAAVELLEEIGVAKYKIGSGETNDLLILERVCKTGKPIILSTGMSSFEELDKSVSLIKKYGNDLSILQCTTKYPVRPEEVGLNVIPELSARYKVAVGISDHSGTIYPSLATVVLGGAICEVHAVFHKEMFGPDTSSSLSISQLKQMVSGIRFLEKACSAKVDKAVIEQFSNQKSIFGKSLAVNKNLDAGHILKFTDLESKKPSGFGISTSDYQNVIGKALNRAKNKWEFINKNDLNE